MPRDDSTPTFRITGRQALLAAIHAAFLDDDARANELARVMVIIDHARSHLSAKDLDRLLHQATALYPKSSSSQWSRT